MEIKAYAKINLSLDVLGEREDGYHLLKMVMQNIDLFDTLHLERIPKGIVLECNKKYVPTDGRNSVYKAIDLFKRTFSINEGLRINIIKNIPVAAGLAGGSADAAAILKAMRDIYKPEVNDEKLMALGVLIGADVPYCIKGGTCLCEGIGELITPLKAFSGYRLVLIKPSFGASTKDVYNLLDLDKIFRHPLTEDIIKYIEAGDIKALAQNMKNVLENVTFNMYPVLKGIKKQLVDNGALGAMMSGSGPTIFGLYDDDLKAEKSYNALKNKYKEVYITKTI
ncbi:MAG TPA: 4-(cytidine 5'-diphospho)-2-C-methyl-D-erythritol kinase [Clostridiaceae bacterium]